MITALLIIAVLIYISLGLLVGTFWYHWLFRKPSWGDEDCFMVAFPLGVIWPISVFIVIIFNGLDRWYKYLLRLGKKLAKAGAE